MEIGPTTRNSYLEKPDKGVYINTTATTPMDKEDAAFQNMKNCLDFSEYNATRTLANWTDYRREINRW